VSILVLPRQWGVVIRCDVAGCEARHVTACTGKARNRLIARNAFWGRAPIAGRRGHGDACPTCMAELQPALSARGATLELLRDPDRLQSYLAAAGNDVTMAATGIGVTTRTLRRWMRRHVARRGTQ
jgi:hypothetical protein